MLRATIICPFIIILVYFTSTVSANAVISPARPIPTHGQPFTMTCNSPVAMTSTFVWILNASQEVCRDCNMTMMMPPNISSFVNSMSFRSKVLATAVQVSSLNLVIDPVTASQHGGNVYDCVAINSQGNFATSVMLQVIAPAFVRQPVSQGDLQVGNSVTLTCIAESHPPPMYQWERFNETSQSFTEIAEETSTMLQFMNLIASDFGMYRCKVTVQGVNAVIISNTATISNITLMMMVSSNVRALQSSTETTSTRPSTDSTPTSTTAPTQPPAVNDAVNLGLAVGIPLPLLVITAGAIALIAIVVFIIVKKKAAGQQVAPTKSKTYKELVMDELHKDDMDVTAKESNQDAQ